VALWALPRLLISFSGNEKPRSRDAKAGLFYALTLAMSYQ
jgi:hypothetical protein